ncbi:MAG: hypothetical protein U0235_09525 [Polyangiaceae bacterium]
MISRVMVMLSVCLLAGCARPSSSGERGSSIGSAAQSVSPPSSRIDEYEQGRCGASPSDWCPGPKDDPCSAHKNTAECRADPKCKGRPYRGESVIACKDDGSGFSPNCPSVGCISR